MPDAPSMQKASALGGRGWLYFVAGHYEKAVEDNQQAISLSPGECTDQGSLAIALLVLGRTGEALASYDSALVLANLKHLEAMATDLRALIEKHGDLSGTQEALARIEARRQFLSQ